MGRVPGWVHHGRGSCEGSLRRALASICDTTCNTLEGLNKLKPAFDSKGTVTAGNASPLTDGAAAAVLMSESKAKELGVKALGYFVDYTVAGVPPDIMGIGPVPAIRKLLERNKLTEAYRTVMNMQ